MLCFFYSEKDGRVISDASKLENVEHGFGDERNVQVVCSNPEVDSVYSENHEHSNLLVGGASPPLRRIGAISAKPMKGMSCLSCCTASRRRYVIFYQCWYSNV